MEEQTSSWQIVMHRPAIMPPEVTGQATATAPSPGGMGPFAFGKVCLLSFGRQPPQITRRAAVRSASPLTPKAIRTTARRSEDYDESRSS